MESCHFRDLASEFAELERHEESALIRWIGRETDDKNALLPAAEDPDREVHKQFGTKRMGPLSGKRATFVIDTDRRL